MAQWGQRLICVRLRRSSLRAARIIALALSSTITACHCTSGSEASCSNGFLVRLMSPPSEVLKPGHYEIILGSPEVSYDIVCDFDGMSSHVHCAWDPSPPAVITYVLYDTTTNTISISVANVFPKTVMLVVTRDTDTLASVALPLEYTETNDTCQDCAHAVVSLPLAS